MLKFNHQKIIEALLILRGELGISIPDIQKITKINDFEYTIYLLNQIEESLKDSPLILKYNPVKKRYFLALPGYFYNFLSEENLIKSIYSKSILATIACIILESEEGSSTIDRLKEIRGKTVLEHLKILEKEELIEIKNQKVTPTNNLLMKIDINAVLKSLKAY
ncbi:MAG: SMC-Scp complex subunit ScpB [Candidatus Helarchaeota archaeon]